ncbi:MAG: phosphatase PAP2 family protein [Bdellovibrionaceae bacterium]|nr:phosphatase PAP2 family protein [Pseudobdellovibrionaceae bacterium]MDW8190140.1 phosphatase PAP2 family protein [Pseudobdellovibrionaceae bacterium]
MSNIVDKIYELDLFLLKIINQEGSAPIFDRIIPALIDLHKSFAIWMLLVTLMIVLFIKNRIYFWFCVFVVVGLALNDFCGNQLKHFFQRNRPDVAGVSVILRCSHFGGPSFPSNHALNSFFLWAVLPSHLSVLRKVFLVFAIFVGWGRVYCGVHYPSDVLGGAILGIFLGRLALLSWQKLVLPRTILLGKKDSGG